MSRKPEGFTSQEQAGTVRSVVVQPTVTASAYTASNVLGGVLALPNIVRPGPNSGIIQSIRCVFKSAQTTNLKVSFFKAYPTASTFNDKVAPTIGAADVLNLIGTYTLSNADSTLGTETIYTSDGIGAAFNLGTDSQTLFCVVNVVSTPTPASTSDFQIEVSVLSD